VSVTLTVSVWLGDWQWDVRRTLTTEYRSDRLRLYRESNHRLDRQNRKVYGYRFVCRHSVVCALSSRGWFDWINAELTPSSKNSRYSASISRILCSDPSSCINGSAMVVIGAYSVTCEPNFVETRSSTQLYTISRERLVTIPAKCHVWKVRGQSLRNGHPNWSDVVLYGGNFRRFYARWFGSLTRGGVCQYRLPQRGCLLRWDNDSRTIVRL